MVVDDGQDADSVVEDEVPQVKSKPRDRRSANLEVLRHVVDDRTCSRPLRDQTKRLIDRIQELVPQSWSLLIEPTGCSIEFLRRLRGELDRPCH